MLKMSQLIKQFENRTELPIEVQEVADAIIKLGVQEEIYFTPVDVDLAHMHGAFRQFMRHPYVYSEPNRVTHIPFNKRDPLELRRVVCCKEMMHFFDRSLEQTKK